MCEREATFRRKLLIPADLYIFQLPGTVHECMSICDLMYVCECECACECMCVDGKLPSLLRGNCEYVAIDPNLYTFSIALSLFIQFVI